MGGLFAGTSLERPVTCAVCDLAVAACGCPKNAAGEVCRPADQPARVQRERRRGKWTTVVRDLDPTASDLSALLKAAKKSRAAGGCITPDGFELQGDQRDWLVDWLKARGYPAKPSGG